MCFPNTLWDSIAPIRLHFSLEWLSLCISHYIYTYLQICVCIHIYVYSDMYVFMYIHICNIHKTFFNYLSPCWHMKALWEQLYLFGSLPGQEHSSRQHYKYIFLNSLPKEIRKAFTRKAVLLVHIKVVFTR